jgi:cysteine/glycine-rich protein
MKKVTSFVATPEMCLSCGKRVYITERVFIDGKAYHTDCFKCTHCRQKLSLGSFAQLDNVPYCKTHLLELFKRNGRYDFAKKESVVPQTVPTVSESPTLVIPKKEQKVEPQVRSSVLTKSQSFHPTVVVSTPPKKSSFSIVREMCVVCNTAVYVNDKIAMDGKGYHQICLRCNQCKCRLTIGNYAQMDGTPFCKTHFTEVFKRKGSYNLKESMKSVETVVREDPVQLIPIKMEIHVDVIAVEEPDSPISPEEPKEQILVPKEEIEILPRSRRNKSNSEVTLFFNTNDVIKDDEIEQMKQYVDLVNQEQVDPLEKPTKVNGDPVEYTDTVLVDVPKARGGIVQVETDLFLNKVTPEVASIQEELPAPKSRSGVMKQETDIFFKEDKMEDTEDVPKPRNGIIKPETDLFFKIDDPIDDNVDPVEPKRRENIRSPRNNGNFFFKQHDIVNHEQIDHLKKQLEDDSSELVPRARGGVIKPETTSFIHEEPEEMTMPKPRGGVIKQETDIFFKEEPINLTPQPRKRNQLLGEATFLFKPDQTIF